MKALIVDDEEDIGIMLSKILTNEGLDTKHVNSITSAFSEIENNAFHFYFLDLNLPDGTGFELIPDIKKNNKQAKIIIISAYDGAVELSRAKDLDVTNFIHKPFSKKQIVELIQNLE